MRKSDDIIVTWEVDDGYVGGSRPHKTYIDRCSWDECEDDDERQELAEESVQWDFDQKITWYIKRTDDV